MDIIESLLNDLSTATNIVNVFYKGTSYQVEEGALITHTKSKPYIQCSKVVNRDDAYEINDLRDIFYANYILENKPPIIIRVLKEKDSIWFLESYQKDYKIYYRWGKRITINEYIYDYSNFLTLGKIRDLSLQERHMC